MVHPLHKVCEHMFHCYIIFLPSSLVHGDERSSYLYDDSYDDEDDFDDDDDIYDYSDYEDSYHDAFESWDHGIDYDDMFPFSRY